MAWRVSENAPEITACDAMIVADDADIRRATAAAAIGRFFNAGQACLAVKRIFLFEKIAEVVEKEKERIRVAGQPHLRRGVDHAERVGSDHAHAV